MSGLRIETQAPDIFISVLYSKHYLSPRRLRTGLHRGGSRLDLQPGSGGQASRDSLNLPVTLRDAQAPQTGAFAQADKTRDVTREDQPSSGPIARVLHLGKSVRGQYTIGAGLHCWP